MTSPLYPSTALYPSTTLYPSAGTEAEPPTVQAIPGLPVGQEARFREAVRRGVKLYYSVDASLGGVPIAGATGLRPVGGSITDTTRPGVRRTLNVQLPPSPGLFDLLAPVGSTLKVTAHVSDSGGHLADVPMGVFDVDSQSLSEGGGALSITAPDKWVRIQRAKFVRPQESIPGLTVSGQIAALIQGALGSDELVTITATSQAKIGVLTWERDRDKAIIELATSIGAWVFFDRDGTATVADVPWVGKAADWLVDASDTGVLTELDRERSRSQASNVVVIESSAADGAKFATQYVWDSDPGSPTYAGVHPIRNPGSAGPFGIVPFYYDTPIIDDPELARLAGLTILARESGLSSQVSLGQVPNPALDAFAVIDVLPPRERPDVARTLERHVVDTVTHGLSVGAVQQIDGRSTRVEEFAG